MKQDVTGQVALMVGGGSGMGRLAAQRWARAGGTAVAADVNAAGLAETARGAAGIHTRVVEVTESAAVDRLVKEVESEIGPIERCYNGAGIHPSGHLLDMEIAEIHRVMEVNYGGLVNVSKSVLPFMLERGRGSLVNFGSIAGWVPSMHFGAYSASKFAVVAFTEVLYHENRGKGVHICCVCPAAVDTPMLDQATSNPKILEVGPPRIPPGKVLDAIDRAITRRRFWVFPAFHSVSGWYIRRFLPGLLWTIDHRAEGY